MTPHGETIAHLKELGKEWRAAQLAANEAKAQLIEALVEADSSLSEYTMAAELGVTRQTIRKWLGK